MDLGGPAKKLKLHYLAIIALLVLNTMVLVQDFSARMALTSADDSPLTAAYYMKNPQAFEHDAFAKNWIHIAMGSMQTWLGVALYNWMDLSPELLYYFWVFLQNVLLGLAVFRFSLSVKPSLTAAWLSVAFTFLGKPFVWNLAAYGDLMYTPYAGHLALPFLILAAAMALEKKALAAVLLLAVGGLFHPPLAFCAGCMLGLFWLWEYRQERNLSALFWRILGLGGVMVVSVAPHQISMHGLQQIPASEMLKLILINSHTIPWRATAYLPNIIHNFFKFLPLLIMAFLAFRQEDLARRAKSFLVCAALATLVLIVLQVVICELRLVALMRLILHRSTLILSMLAVPFAMNFLLSAMPKANWMDRFVTAAALMSPGKYLMLALGAVSLPLSFKNRPSERLIFNHLGWLGYLGYGLTLVMVLPNFLTRATYYVSRVLYHTIGWDPGYLSIPLLEHVSVYVPLTAALAVVIMARASKKEPQGAPAPAAQDKVKPWSWAWGTVIVVMCLGFLYVSHVQAGFALTQDARQWYQVQEWAREHTPPNARFTLAGTNPFYSWRSYSKRPVTSCYRVGQYYVYSLQAWDYDQRLKRFYQKKCKISDNDWLFNNVHSCFLGMSEASVMEFARDFKADYLVTRVENKFSFPVAYKNNAFIVYKLQN